MKIAQIIQLLDATVYHLPTSSEHEIRSVAACDLMSDVLANPSKDKILLTGLTNSQTIRTAALLDLCGVVIVRGKEPQPEAVELAKKMDMPLLGAKWSLFAACAKLHEAGLRGMDEKD